MARLGDVCLIQAGGTPSRSNGTYWEGGTIPWVKISDFDGKHLSSVSEYITEQGLDNSSAKLFCPGTILYTIFATLGETCILDVEATTNQAIAGLQIIDDRLTTEYLYYFLVAQKDYVNEIGRGVAQNNINLGILRNMQIDIPSIVIQQQVAQSLAKVDNLISLRKQQIAKLDELVKARFVEMTREAGGVPTRMGDIATFVNGYAFKPTDWSQTGRPIIRIQNLNNPQAEFNYFQGEIDNKYLVRDGDVLISWATHFEAYYWKGGDAWLNQHIFRVDFNKIHVDKMYFIFATEEALRQAFRNAHGFKPTMEHLKRKDFEDAVVVLPELATQRKFAAFVAQTDQQKLTIQQSLAQLELLKKALMQKYFG